MSEHDGRTWTLESRESLHEGFYGIDLLRFRHSLHRGGESGTIERELFVRGNVVGVLPWDPVTDQVLLVEQFRIGAMHQAPDPWLWEIIAGMIDTDESPEQVARREAHEEAGLEIGALHPISRYLASPGSTTEEVFLYCAETDLSGTRDGHFGLEHENEDIRTRVVSAEAAIGMLETREVRNGLSVIALQWLALERMRRRD